MMLYFILGCARSNIL